MGAVYAPALLSPKVRGEVYLFDLCCICGAFQDRAARGHEDNHQCRVHGLAKPHLRIGSVYTKGGERTKIGVSG